MQNIYKMYFLIHVTGILCREIFLQKYTLSLKLALHIAGTSKDCRKMELKDKGISGAKKLEIHACSLRL